MPSRFALTSTPATVQAQFGYANGHDFPPREVIAPTEPVMIVRRGHGGEREAHLVRWGLIPSWVRDFDKLGMMAVARTETVMDKPSFRGGIRHKRCLVPADAFHVWKGEKGARRRHTIGLGDGRLMGFAAIYEEWMGADGSEIDSMAILTQPAVASISKVADRMPACLRPEHYADWLDCRGVRADEAMALISGASASEGLEILAARPKPAV